MAGLRPPWNPGCLRSKTPPSHPPSTITTSAARQLIIITWLFGIKTNDLILISTEHNVTCYTNAKQQITVVCTLSSSCLGKLCYQTHPDQICCYLSIFYFLLYFSQWLYCSSLRALVETASVVLPSPWSNSTPCAEDWMIYSLGWISFFCVDLLCEHFPPSLQWENKCLLESGGSMSSQKWKSVTV